LKIRLLFLLTALSILLISCSSGNYIRGKKELEAGNYQGAIASLQESVEKNASRSEPWKYLGIAYYHDQKYGEAADALKQATILAPDDGAAILYLGLSYERLGENRQAAAVYQEYISREPDGEFSHRIRHRVKYLTDQAVKEEVQKVIAGEKSIKTEAIPDNTGSQSF
jgi:tetratricopeptide (TPR) repeat protein